MCTSPITLRRPATFGERLRGISSESVVQIPCGKCPECMKRKQNSIKFRVYNEALKRGSLDFLTLTYSNESLPFSESLWSVDRRSGEMTLYGDCHVSKSIPSWIKEEIINDRASESVHRMKSKLVRHVFSDFDDSRDYYLAYSPCHDYNDVQLLLKRIRKYYHDLTGQNADFSFLCVPEFGEHNSRRPHFHMCLFGAPELFVHFFVRAWSEGFYKPKAAFVESHNSLGLSRRSFCNRDYALRYGLEYFRCYQSPIGFVDHRHVNHVNNDGSDGFAKCATYVGKYVGKGVFEDVLVKDGFVSLPRITQSIRFGSLPDDLVNWHLCRDLYGDYDDEELSGLSKSEVDKIVESVSNRLYHSFGSKDYALPIQFLKTIFKGRVAISRNSVPAFLKSAAFSFDQWPDSGKMVFSALFYKVQDFVRDRYLQDLQKKFEAFVSHYPSKDFLSAVIAFEEVRVNSLKARAEIALSRQRKSLSSLKF